MRMIGSFSLHAGFDRSRAFLSVGSLAAGFLVLIFASAAHAATFGQPAGTGPSPDRKKAVSQEEPSVAWSGYLNLRYAFRTAETPSAVVQRDQDVYADLRIDAVAQRTNKYEFHFLGSVRSDLDGNRDLHTNYLLEDIGDTGHNATSGYLYEAHVDINDPFTRVSQMRIGRQAGTRDEPVYFDGIALDVRATPSVKFTLYGGALVNLFEIGRSEGDDSVAGAGVDLSGANTGVSLDYLHIKDKRDYLELTDVTDDLAAFKVWQRFTPNVKGTARFRSQNSEARDLSVRLLGTFPGAGSEFSANYLRLFHAQSAQSAPLSPFVDVMGPQEPFQTYEVKVRQFVGTRYAFDLVYAKRDLLQSSASTTFNREYSRTAAGFEVNDLFARNLLLTLTVDQWKSGDRSDLSAGADIGYAFGKRGMLTKLNVGTYYSLYKYDYYLQPSEKDDVRTYYLTVRAPVARQVALSLHYELERSLEDFKTFKAGIRYDF